MNWLKRISFKRNKAIKWLYFSVNVVCARFLNQPVILCFHRVKNPSDSLLDKRIGVTKPHVLEEVIRFFRIAGYQFVSLERMMQIIEEGNLQKVVAVTFDDGLSDLHENAFPIMKKHHIPFTCFLITSLLGSTKLLWLHKLYISWDRIDKPVRDDILRDYIKVDDTMQRDEKVAGDIVHSLDGQGLVDLATRLSEIAQMSPEDEEFLARDLYLHGSAIEEMKANGLTIELHGHNHWPLTMLSEEETKQELETSLTVIREKLQSRAQFFAMPYGKSNPYLKDVAKQLDIRGVFTIQGKLLTGHNKDPYNLPRFCIYDDVQAFYRSLSVEFIKYIAAKFSKN